MFSRSNQNWQGADRQVHCGGEIMATPYSWHPGSNDVVPRWAVPVQLLPDELLSSWLTRAALDHGCDPLVLTGSLWPKWRVWTLDFDRGGLQGKLGQLSFLSGVREEWLSAATLGPTIGELNQRPLQPNAVWPWILAVGARNRIRHGGLQFCPRCLAEDRIPYYRLHWRFAWHSGCQKHRVLLLDKCSTCRRPIEPHRLSAGDRDLAVCASCKSDLRDGHVAQTKARALAFQTLADQALCGVGVCYGSDQLTAREWFNLCRFFLTLLRKSLRSRPLRLVELIATLGVDIEQLSTPATGLPLELLPAHERDSLLAATSQLLNLGPAVFLEAAIAVGLTKASLCDVKQSPPASIDHILSRLPTTSKTFRKILETPSFRRIKPCPKGVIMRKLARLQRKMR
ncbi:TniQ family protein [Geomonas silvestris]|uniref:TniQ family protein n=1 Tax=Geomonas silvestris TaxID=2740184 RepID=UPI0035308915